jgi:hypothetical protein
MRTDHCIDFWPRPPYYLQNYIRNTVFRGSPYIGVSAYARQHGSSVTPYLTGCNLISTVSRCKIPLMLLCHLSSFSRQLKYLGTNRRR